MLLHSNTARSPNNWQKLGRRSWQKQPIPATPWPILSWIPTHWLSYQIQRIKDLYWVFYCCWLLVFWGGLECIQASNLQSNSSCSGRIAILIFVLFCLDLRLWNQMNLFSFSFLFFFSSILFCLLWLLLVKRIQLILLFYILVLFGWISAHVTGQSLANCWYPKWLHLPNTRRLDKSRQPDQDTPPAELPLDSWV